MFNTTYKFTEWISMQYMKAEVGRK